MKCKYMILFLLGSIVITKAQEVPTKVGKSYNESVDSVAVSPQLIEVLRKIAPKAKDVSWGHLFCTKCPKDGTYSYYQADFYQGDDQASITFSETAQPIAFKLKVDLVHTPKEVQSAINKKVKKLEVDFGKIDLDILSFSVREKVRYKVTFYIPTEDKKHWTQYEQLVLTEKGSKTTSTDID